METQYKAGYLKYKRKYQNLVKIRNNQLGGYNMRGGGRQKIYCICGPPGEAWYNSTLAHPMNKRDLVIVQGAFKNGKVTGYNIASKTTNKEYQGTNLLKKHSNVQFLPAGGSGDDRGIHASKQFLYNVNMLLDKLTTKTDIFKKQAVGFLINYFLTTQGGATKWDSSKFSAKIWKEQSVMSKVDNWEDSSRAELQRMLKPRVNLLDDFIDTFQDEDVKSIFPMYDPLTTYYAVEKGCYFEGNPLKGDDYPSFFRDKSLDWNKVVMVSKDISIRNEIQKAILDLLKNQGAPALPIQPTAPDLTILTDLGKDLDDTLNALYAISLLQQGKINILTFIVCGGNEDWRMKECDALINILQIDPLIRHRIKKTEHSVSDPGTNKIKHDDASIYSNMSSDPTDVDGMLFEGLSQFQI